MARYQQGFYLFSLDFEVIQMNARGDGIRTGLNITTASSGVGVIVSTGSAYVDGIAVTSSSPVTISFTPDSNYPYKSVVYIANNGTVDKKNGIPEEQYPTQYIGKATARPKPPFIPVGCLPLAEVWVPKNATSSTQLDIFTFDVKPNRGLL